MIEVIKKIEGLYIDDFIKQFGFDNISSVRKEIIETLKKEKAITVHSGSEFHQDETMGVATLLYVAKNILDIEPNEITIIRTRNVSEFKGVVIDVGSTYCDHHMEPCKCAIRKNGNKYASAGLVWAYLGSLVVAERFVEKIDRKLFEPSDMCDNGEGKSSTSYAELMCPIDETEDIMECFMEAVNHYMKCLDRIISYYNKLKEKGDITPYIKEGEKTGIMILDKYIPWEEEAIDSDIKFVVWKNEDEKSEDKYLAKVVPIEPGSFTAKIPFPETYKGISILGKRSDFFSHCGLKDISGLNFVHSERFFACSKDIESLLAVINSVV